MAQQIDKGQAFLYALCVTVDDDLDHAWLTPLFWNHYSLICPLFILNRRTQNCTSLCCYRG
jgi:hypothetical protein